MDDDLLTIDDIAAKLGAARRTVAEKWIHAPEFPAPAQAPSRRMRKWRASDVAAWAARALPPLPRRTPGSSSPATS